MSVSKEIKPLVIIGAGGFGREVACIVEDINKVSAQWDFKGFIDDGLKGKTVEGYKILGSLSTLDSFPIKPWVVIAIGDTITRSRIAEKLEEKGYRFVTLVHPSVLMSQFVSIGCGTVICKGTILTTNIEIGKHCIINNLCRVGHDARINNCVSLMGGVGIAGETVVGEGCYFSSGSITINQLVVGEWTTIGAGAVVTKDLPANVLAVGVPAKIVKTNYRGR